MNSCESELSSHRGKIPQTTEIRFSPWTQACNSLLPDGRWNHHWYPIAYWLLQPAVTIVINLHATAGLFTLSGWLDDRQPSSNQSHVALLQHPSELSTILHFYFSLSRFLPAPPPPMCVELFILSRCHSFSNFCLNYSLLFMSLRKPPTYILSRYNHKFECIV